MLGVPALDVSPRSCDENNRPFALAITATGGWYR
jgi:hypothetical protein